MCLNVFSSSFASLLILRLRAVLVSYHSFGVLCIVCCSRLYTVALPDASSYTINSIIILIISYTSVSHIRVSHSLFSVWCG